MSTIDWTICILYLLVICLQGWWFASRQKTNEDYFIGSRRMNWIPVGISLFATTFSSLSFVGLPRAAAYEDYHLYLAILFIPLFVAPIVGAVFIPLYHRLKLISAYEYLGRRFNHPIRLAGSTLYGLHALGWMGTMLYAVGLILQQVLNLDETQFVWLIVGLGMFTTVYTSLGGYRTVVWTDVIQAMVLSLSVVVIILLAVGKIGGGWGTVWSLGIEHNKFEMFDMTLDPTQKSNFFSACAYGMFVYLAAHATGQSAVQRYVSMPSVSAARWSLVINGVMVSGVCLLFFIFGTVLFAFYHQYPGDILQSGFPEAVKQDQLATHFIQTELAYPGLLGILLAGLFTAAMSSLDSGINNLTALTVCDWLGGRQMGVWFNRMLCVFFGAATIGIALLVPYLGEHVFDILMRIAGAFFGPLLGLFLLGIFVPRANCTAALLGLAASVLSLVLIFPTEIASWWYGAFTAVPMLAVGWIASWFNRPPEPQRVDGLVVRLRRSLDD